jgi:hypothetical protein
VQLRPGSTDPAAIGNDGAEALRQVVITSQLGAEKQITNNLFVSVSAPLCQFSTKQQGNSQSELLGVVNGLTGKVEYRFSRDASIRAGKEPSALVCGRATTGRVIPTPSQWGVSLFKTWRF